MNIYTWALKLAVKAIIVKESVEQETANERYLVCTNCPMRDAEQEKCTKCGCFLEEKTGSKVNWNPKKLRNEITHCPLGKWGDIETTNIYRQLDGKETLK